MTAASLILALMVVGSAESQDPPRDTRMAAGPGTAAIAGVVVNDDAQPQPLRRVRVTINSSDREVGRTAITDDSGQFTFAALPPGRYTLAATKEGYVNTSYGAKRPERPGTPIALADGQRIANISLRMQRAGVITGTIVDQNAEPAKGINVTALRYMFTGGERRLMMTRSSSQGTDDRGMYRIYGLAPGEYVVSATLRSLGPFAPGTELRLMTDGEIRSALELLRDAGRPSGPGGQPTALSAPAPGAAPSVGYATVFYPGTTIGSQAGTVSVAAGEERSGVDFQLQLVHTAKIDGTVLLPDGAPAISGTVTMVGVGQASVPGLIFDNIRTSRPDAEGHFSFGGISPGQYVLLSRGGTPAALPASADPNAPPNTAPLWASADLAVEGQNISGLTLNLQPGLTVSGTIALDGGTLPPPQLNRLRVNLSAPQSGGQANLGVSAATVDTEGRFTISGIAPGSYRLMTTVPGSRPDAPGWVMKTAMLDGQDTLDEPYPLKRSVEGAVITLTDKTTELSGTVQDASGQIAPEYSIVVFPADQRYWRPLSRRIQSVRPASSGRYVVRNLPPGEYYMAAVVDMEPGEAFDPAFLRQLAPGAFRITLSEGEKKSQDIRAGK